MLVRATTVHPLPRRRELTSARWQVGQRIGFNRLSYPIGHHPHLVFVEASIVRPHLQKLGQVLIGLVLFTLTLLCGVCCIILLMSAITAYSLESRSVMLILAGAGLAGSATLILAGTPILEFCERSTGHSWLITQRLPGVGAWFFAASFAACFPGSWIADGGSTLWAWTGVPILLAGLLGAWRTATAAEPEYDCEECELDCWLDDATFAAGNEPYSADATTDARPESDPP